MSDLISRKGVFIPDITVEMFRNASLESIEDLMASGEMEDILLPSAQPEPIKINIDDFNKEDLERFKKELGNTPITVLPAQPEIIRCKIIRCKDCKFASGDSRICMKFGHSPIGELDFCAWAERKTDE